MNRSQLYVAFIDFRKAYDFVPHNELFYKMLHGGMARDGRTYLPHNTQYVRIDKVDCIRHNNDVSNIISQHIGLRQGCILSPCLFSFYIADLPKYLEEKGCKGVWLHDGWIRALLYADDGALLASTPADLQRMLEVLKEYCSKWRMFVNNEKTEIVVFNNAKLNDVHVFTYDKVLLKVVNKFKYLGVMLHNSDKYNTCIEHRLQQCRRLVAVWLRRSKIWSLCPNMVVNQFNTCVLPALEYGVGVWYTGRMSCKKEWGNVEVLWRTVARQILGVSTYAPMGGVAGDLG